MRNFAMHVWLTWNKLKDQAAFVGPGEDGGRAPLTYVAWLRAAQHIAIALMERGFEPGARIAMVGANSPRWWALAAGAWIAGGCVVPLVPGRDRRETLRCMARSGASFIAVEDLDALERLRGQGDRLPPTLQWLVLGKGEAVPESDTITTYDALKARGRFRSVRGDDEKLKRRAFETPLDQPSLVLFDPEPGADLHGAYFSGAKLAAMLDQLAADLLLPEDPGEETFAPLMSFGWFPALLWTMAASLKGVPIAYAETMGELVKALPSLGVTRLLSGPAFLEGQARAWRAKLEGQPELLRQLASGESQSGLLGALSALGAGAAERALYEPIQRELGSSLKSVYVYGGRVPGEVHDILEQVEIDVLGLFGVPEAGVTHFERAGAARRDSVGRPMQGVACKIEGAKGSEAGPVLVRAEHLFDGYWDDRGPREVVDGWLDTGRIGKIEGGYLLLEERATGSEDEEE